jgi:hypothetical protein
MAAPTNTFLTFSQVGAREDLTDKIYNIAPVDVPFSSMIDKTKASAVLHEWQTQALATAAGNAQIEGDDVSFASPTATARINNRCQIMRKEVVVSRTADKVSKAGRNSEIVYQMALKRAELKRDKEFVLLSNQAPVTGNSSTARQLRPLCGWITTNQTMGAGGAVGSTSAARTDGTQRTLIEPMLVAAMQTAWVQGGNPTMVLTGPKQRAVISSFNGGATKFYSVEDKKLSATIQVYEGDFGTVKIVTDRFMRGAQTTADREIFVLDTDFWGWAELDPVHAEDLAKTGDSEKGMLIVEGTLEARQEASSAAVFDLT